MSPQPPPTRGGGGPLEATWEVTSVRQDGEPDPTQVGARLRFAGGEVQFQPNVVQFIDDGTS
jgi:hypothetical protein